MIVTIMQPAYLPWLGYFHRIWLSDLFVILDHVQIDRNSKTGFASRNKIRQPQGWAWLTVPLKTKGRHGDLMLNEIEIANDQAWRDKHLKSIRHSYAKAPSFGRHSERIEAIYAREWLKLTDLAYELTAWQLDSFGIRTPVAYSSQLNVGGSKDELILNLCKATQATTYLSGPFGREYLNLSLFADSGITVEFHDYAHPQYRQAYAGFEPFMAALDLQLNHGAESLRILRAGNEAIEGRLGKLEQVAR